jgi:hypothetical protein
MIAAQRKRNIHLLRRFFSCAIALTPSITECNGSNHPGDKGRGNFWQQWNNDGQTVKAGKP